MGVVGSSGAFSWGTGVRLKQAYSSHTQWQRAPINAAAMSRSSEPSPGGASGHRVFWLPSGGSRPTMYITYAWFHAMLGRCCHGVTAHIRSGRA